MSDLVYSLHELSVLGFIYFGIKFMCVYIEKKYFCFPQQLFSTVLISGDEKREVKTLCG